MHPVQAQSTKVEIDSIVVSFNFENTTLREALNQIVVQTNLQLTYKDEIVKGIRITKNFDNVSLHSLLDSLILGNGLTYKIISENQIVIFKKEKALNNTTIKGYIRDAYSHETLPYANIVIRDTKYGTSSNVNGYFVLLNIPAESCTLDIHYIGYEDYSIVLDENNRSGLINIAMKQKAIGGEEITVTAENIQTIEIPKEPSYVRVSPKQIENMPALGTPDLMRSLQMLPGIGGMNDGSTGIFIRGGTPDQNLIILDGMPIYHIDHFFGFVSAFNIDAVKDVRVMKAAFPAKYGGRLSGILELTGKSGNSNAFQAGVNFGSISGGAMVQVPVNKRGGLLLSFRRSNSEIVGDGLYSDILNALEISGKENEPGGPPFVDPNPPQKNESPEFYYYDVNSKFSYMLTERDLVSLSFYRGLDFLDQSSEEQNIDGPPGITKIKDITEWKNIGFSGKWSRRWSDRIFSNVLIADTKYTSESERSGDFPSQDTTSFSSFETTDVQNLDVRFDNEWQVAASHKLEFGGQVLRTNITNKFTSEESVQILDQNKEAVENVLYLEDKWRIAKPLEITLGLRSTYYEPIKKLYYEPRTSFKYNLTDNLYLKGAWGKYNQFIYRISNESILEGNRDLWLVADNNLKPGTSDQKIIGIGFDKKDYLFDMEAYYKDLSNVTEFTQIFRRSPDNPPGDVFYLGNGRSYGIEFLLQKKKGWLTGWLGYTLGKVDYKIPEINQGQWYPASQDRRHEINFIACSSWRNWRFNISGMYGSGLPYTNPVNSDVPMINGDPPQPQNAFTANNARLPDYLRFDAGISYNFSLIGLEWNTGFSVYNLFNHKNIWARQFIDTPENAISRDVTALGITPTLNISINFKQNSR